MLEPEVMDTEAESEAYDAMDHQEANLAFVARLLALGVDQFLPNDQVLDIGTGPGLIPLLLCDRQPYCQVVGVDLADTMLERARGHAQASPHLSRLDFQRADAKCLPFADEGFAAVCSNTILHHIPEPLPFLREALRVLRPGGVLLIRDLFRPDSLLQVNKIVKKHASGENPVARGLLSDSLCAALTPAELFQLACEAGLEPFQLVIDSDRHMSLQKGPRLL